MAKQRWVFDKESFTDFLGYMIVHAPDFPEEDFLAPEEQLDLETAFLELRDGLRLLEAKLGSNYAVALELLNRSQSGFLAGDESLGGHLLQDLDALLHGRLH